MQLKMMMAFALAGMALACGSPLENQRSNKAAGCASDADCLGLQTCSVRTGQCRALEPGMCRQDDPSFCACNLDQHCPEGFECGSALVCESIPSPNEAPESDEIPDDGVGSGSSDPEPVESCERSSDCPIDQFCDELINACNELPSGMCRTDSQCVSENCYVRPGREVGRCVEAEGCTEDTDCGARQICRDAACLDVECREDRHCGAGSGCDNYRCVARERRDDHGNTFDTATRIEDMGQASGAIDYSGDRDVFRFEATVTGRYVVETTGQTDTVCTALTANEEVLGSDDDDGAGDNCSLAFAARAGSTLQIQLTGFRDRTGSYRLVLIRPVEGANPGVGDNEGGNGEVGGENRGGGNPPEDANPEDQGGDVRTAQRVQLPAEIPAQLDQRDEDWFQFTTERAGRYRFETRSRLDTDCKLLDEDENQVGISDDDGQMLNCQINVTLDGGTTYFFAIRGYTSNINGPYTAILRSLD